MEKEDIVEKEIIDTDTLTTQTENKEHDDNVIVKKDEEIQLDYIDRSVYDKDIYDLKETFKNQLETFNLKIDDLKLKYDEIMSNFEFIKRGEDIVNDIFVDNDTILTDLLSKMI